MWLLIDDAGEIRGLFRNQEWLIEPSQEKPGIPRALDIDGQLPRILVEVADDDPRVVARLNPTEPVREQTVSRAEFNALKTRFEELKKIIEDKA